MKKDNVVAIDGPSGSGKSTVARIVAKKLGFLFVDTGSMFRALAFGLYEKGINAGDQASVEREIGQLEVNYVGKDDNLIDLNGVDISSNIREHHISEYASKISVFPAVRDCLKNLQRGLAVNNNCVLEGRDIGTVIFPDAKLKIFLTASNEKRAERRYQELKSKGTLGDLTKSKILDDINLRDMRDSSREVAPLKPAADSIQIVTDTLSIDEVVNLISQYASENF